MRNIWILTFVVLLTWTSTFGQQDPVYSQYMFNTMAINPGYAGSNNIICATAVSRQQWIGFEGAPSTTIFHVDAAVQPFGISSGVGLALMNDQAGFDKNMGITGTYAYQKELGFGKLGIGLSFGMLNNHWIRTGSFQRVIFILQHPVILSFQKTKKVSSCWISDLGSFIKLKIFMLDFPPHI